MQKFELVIRNEKIKTYRLICLMIVILNALLFAVLLFDAQTKNNGLIAIVFIIAYTLFRFFKSKRSKPGFFFDEWILFLVMMLWVVENNYFFAMSDLILFLLYSAAIDKTVYSFGQERIKQKNFPWKKYSWEQLSNVLLKDNMLTMDFKNNRLLQMQTENDINERDFNEYAKEQIRMSNIESC
jgi:hypothetical protein